MAVQGIEYLIDEVRCVLGLGLCRSRDAVGVLRLLSAEGLCE